MDSEKVEGLCVPLLFPHGEHGYTNASKSCMSPDEYVMSRLLMPKKIGVYFMTAQAMYAPFECIDSRTDEEILPTEDPFQIDEHQVQGVSIRRCLRVNCFMLMARLAQYWLMGFIPKSLIRE